jgi:hypothetical protein
VLTAPSSSPARCFTNAAACDKLETAYIRDMVPPEAYTPACNNLIGKFKIQVRRRATRAVRRTGLLNERGRWSRPHTCTLTPLALPPSVVPPQLEALKSMRAIDSIDTFLRDYNISLPQVYTRLVVDGVPATALHKSADSRLESLAVAECVSCMITSLDVLRLGQRAVGECGGWLRRRRWAATRRAPTHSTRSRRLTVWLLHVYLLPTFRPPSLCADEIMPNLTPVCESLSKAPMIKGDHPTKVKLDAWCVLPGSVR